MPDALPIPLLDLTRALDELEPALTDAFTRVLRSGHYILGEEVTRFETSIAPLCGARHAVAVSSGSDALLLSLMALQVQRGDEVICPAYTFFASGGSIWRVGARPLFVDSCPGCFNLLPSEVEAAISPKTRAIMPVHLFGQVADMAAISTLAKKHRLAVIEDAAQALGAASAPTGEGLAGSLGDLGCFSFFPSKNLGALGDAGLVTTQDAALAEHCRVLRGHGAKPKYYHAHVGGNFRMDALQAALLAVKLPQLDHIGETRQRNAARYDALFTQSGRAAPGTCLCDGSPFVPPTASLILPRAHRGRHIFNQYVVRFTEPGRRDQVRQYLTERRIGCEVYYPVPLHLQACFAALGHRPGELPHAEAAARETLALPIFPGLTPGEIERVVDEVLRACAQ